jgi:hypothetical protein
MTSFYCVVHPMTSFFSSPRWRHCVFQLIFSRLLKIWKWHHSQLYLSIYTLTMFNVLLSVPQISRLLTCNNNDITYLVSMYFNQCHGFQGCIPVTNNDTMYLVSMYFDQCHRFQDFLPVTTMILRTLFQCTLISATDFKAAHLSCSRFLWGCKRLPENTFPHSSLTDLECRPESVGPRRVARFFLAHDTKTGKMYQINIKCTKWS